MPQVETSAAEKALNNLSLISDSQNYNHPSVAAASGQAVSHLVPTEMVGESFDHESIKKHLLRPGRTLMNPFDPSQTTVKVTSNRRRWTHIFPSKAAANPSNPEAAKVKEKTDFVSWNL